MALFRHPSLIRGTVHTPHGAFAVVRAVVDLSDEIGEALGWERVEGGFLATSHAHGAGREALRPMAVRMDRQDAN